MGNLERRLETLETHEHFRPEQSSGEARERMTAHLGRVARLRRGELSGEEAAEVEAESAAVKWRMDEIRGEGAIVNG